ncbi:MAG: hypothetical protein JJE40_00435 [Vicinamibacteria bacterium]|nr:hypothetical protein [Vicinamibacteria bacterium]
MTPDEYCRAIESHLTRKNDGHLIRIVGPAFELVRGWAEQGIPFKVAGYGIDRAFERYYAKGARRRPLRIEFCKDDVLDAFDQWRRAVGVRGVISDDQAPLRRQGLATHITRAISRLTALRGGATSADGGQALRLADDVLDEVVRALDGLGVVAERARGEARERILTDLAALDARLIDAARAAAGEAVLAELATQAEDDLRPFRDRMPADAWRQARAAAQTRLLRERAQLPALAGE